MSIRHSKESVAAVLDALSVARNLAGNAQVELLRDPDLKSPETADRAVGFVQGLGRMDLLQRDIGATLEGTRELYRFLSILDAKRRGEDPDGLAALVSRTPETPETPKAA